MKKNSSYAYNDATHTINRWQQQKILQSCEIETFSTFYECDLLWIIMKIHFSYLNVKLISNHTKNLSSLLGEMWPCESKFFLKEKQNSMISCEGWKEFNDIAVEQRKIPCVEIG